MSNTLKIILSKILIVLLFISCSSVKILKQDNSSIIAISATSSGLGAKGFGILITMVKIDTHEIYKSESLSPVSAHSVIQNIPPGKYIVQKVEMPVGNLIYSNWSDSVKTYFGQIDIEPNSKYYLGDFTGTRETGSKNVLRLKIKNQEIPEGLREKIENEKTGWLKGDFINLSPGNNEALLVY
ncbi:MAG: hypothetical protein MUC78_10855 [Bacteroidales bacterium]|jgi:hypothetical protein|nr:hypothetical protein [Bacteroidales bacterium]